MLIVVVLVSASVFIYFWGENHQSMINESMVYSKDSIINQKTTSENETIYDIDQSDNFITDDEIINNEEIIE